MNKQQNEKGNDGNSFNVRNILVSKAKNSDFLEFYCNNKLLNKCPFFREPLVSGPYYIYTLDQVDESVRKIIREHQDEWISTEDTKTK